MRISNKSMTIANNESFWWKWFSCLISTASIGLILFLISTTIVISLIPLYIRRSSSPASDFQSSLLDLKYSTPRSLISDISGNTMTLREGSLSSDRVKILEFIFQAKLNANPKFKNLRINIIDATIELVISIRRRRLINKKQKFRRRRLANGNDVTIYQVEKDSPITDQLKISFRFLRRESFTKPLISSVLNNTFDQIVFNLTTFFALFGKEFTTTTLTTSITTLSTTTIDLSRSIVTRAVKDNEIMKFDGVSIFGIKDYNGNLQIIYAIETENAIYTIKRRRIIRIQSKNETFVFNYNDTDSSYVVLLVLQNSSYEIPATYKAPNITFPTPVFEFSQNETVPNIFSGVLLELRNTVTNRLIDDATVLMNYFDANYGNKSLVMLNMGGGRYYGPLPTNDTVFDKYFDMNKLFTTITQQSDGCLQLIQAYPIADICSKVPVSVNSSCSLIIQEMTIKIPNVLRTTSQYISQFNLQSASLGEVSDFEVVAFISGEEAVTISLNSSNQVNVTSRTRSIRATNNLNRNNLNKFSVQAGGARGHCNEQTVSGNDTPDDRVIDIGKSHTTVKFSYETYIIKDQIDVYYKNRQIFSTGCVGANGETSIALDDNESTLRVSVTPDCAGETGTAWMYTIQCTDGLICEDNICYCGVNRKSSVQIKPATFNGCGGEGGDYNFLIQSIGFVWGFTFACNTHDVCYGTCNQFRTSCDLGFLANMLSSCAKYAIFPQLFLHCTLWADIYALAVSFAGSDFFKSAQMESCDCINARRRRRDIYYSNATSIALFENNKM